MQQSSLGTNFVGSSSAGKNFAAVDSKMKTSQEEARKSNHTQGCNSKMWPACAGKGLLSFICHTWNHSWNTVSAAAVSRPRDDNKLERSTRRPRRG